MKFLITGGNGQLGRSVAKVAGEFPQHAMVFTDMPEADITDYEVMHALVREHKPDVIVNCAAYTAVDMAESEPETCARINVEGPRVLARVARENDISLIHISTDYVFDGNGCRPIHEDHPASPVGVYGTTKLAGEQQIVSSGCRAAIVRTAWLYSEFGNNFVKTMLRLGRERDSVNVVYDQTGTPTYAPDLARAVVLLAQQGVSGCEVYHFSNEGVTSWFDFARAIFEIEGMEVTVSPVESDRYPTAARRPAYSVLSKQKIKNKNIPVPYWTDSLRECLKESRGKGG